MRLNIKCPCELHGIEYNGVSVVDGVDVIVGDACDPNLGKVVTFRRSADGVDLSPEHAPTLFVQAVSSVSIGDVEPASYLTVAP